MPVFQKNERLCSKKIIDKIYLESTSFINYPLLLSYIYIENSGVPAQILFTVPKKRFKKAHDRNRIKRLMREAYRHNKENLYDYLRHNNKSIALSVSYLATELPEYSEIFNQTQKAISKIIMLIEKCIKK